MSKATIHVGDRVRSIADPGVWIVRRLIRADRDYRRRAHIERNGITIVRGVDLLMRIPETTR